MTVPADAPEALEGRIRGLERQLAALRRSLLPDREELPTASFTALEVWAGRGGYLIDVESVREVLPLMAPSPIPEAPVWVLGHFVLEGRAVPLLDLAVRLGSGPPELRPDRFVVLVDAGTNFGLAVDAVGSVLRVEPAELEPPPRIAQAPFLRATLSRSSSRPLHLLGLSRLSLEVELDDAS